MHDIFISYASEDEAVARSLADGLRDHGWSVWWDRSLMAGDTFRDVIAQQLADARCVIVLWSANSVASAFVREEADRAQRRACLVPVVIDGSEPPLGFGEIQFVSWAGSPSDESYQKIVDGVTRQLAQSPTSGKGKSATRSAGKGHLGVVEWIGLATMAGGVMLTLYIIPSSVLGDTRLTAIAQILSWVLGLSPFVGAWRSPATLAKASRSTAFRVAALLLVTVPWLFVLPLVTIRPKLIPSDLHYLVSIDGEPKELPEFSVRLRNAPVVLKAADDRKSEFPLGFADLLWTFAQPGSRWRLLEPEWRLIYELQIDCLGQACPTPLTVTLTLDGGFDNRDPAQLTYEGKAIAFDSPGRDRVALHAGTYTVTIAVDGKPCQAPPESLAILQAHPYYRVRAGNCAGAVR